MSNVTTITFSLSLEDDHQHADVSILIPRRWPYNIASNIKKVISPNLLCLFWRTSNDAYYCINCKHFYNLYYLRDPDKLPTTRNRALFSSFKRWLSRCNASISLKKKLKKAYTIFSQKAIIPASTDGTNQNIQ